MTSSAFSDAVESFLVHRRHPETFTEIAFYGGNFLGQADADIRHLLALAARYVTAGAVHGIRFSTRPDTVTARHRDLLSSYPVTTVELGVQSMDDAVLAAALRGHTAADTRQAASLLSGTQIRLGLQIMVGLPGESPESAVDTARKTAALRPDFVRIYPTLVLRDSPLARRYHAGRYHPLSLTQAVSRVKAQYTFFRRRHIAVVRMGLQASPELADPGKCIAGPYHPAFGHLVLSALAYDKIRGAVLARCLSGRAITITTHPRSESRARGDKNENLIRLRRNHGVAAAMTADASLSMDAYRVAAA